MKLAMEVVNLEPNDTLVTMAAIIPGIITRNLAIDLTPEEAKEFTVGQQIAVTIDPVASGEIGTV